MKAQHLIVLRFSAFGDVAMMLPVLRCILAQYPQLHLTLVTRSQYAPVFSELKRVSLHKFQPKEKHRGLKGLWRLYKELKENKPMGVVDLHGVLRTHILMFFFLLSGTRARQIHKGRREKRQLTRSKNKALKPLTPTLYRYAEVFRKMGFPIDLEQHEFPIKKALPSVFEQQFSKGPTKWIGIAPFASYQGKMYPLDLMQQVIAYLQRDHQVFLFGAGEQEKHQLNIWEKAFPKAHSLAGKHTLNEELALIANLDIMLSMDSANAHLAANYNVPVITLWGVTHPYAGFTAWGQPDENHLCANRQEFPLIPTSVYGNKYPEGYQNAFRTISPKSVIEAVLDRVT